MSWGALAGMIAGLGLRTWAVFVLGAFFTWNVELRPGQRMIQSGPYRVIRHPGYTGALLMILSSCVLLESWITVALASMALPLAFARRVRHEEHVLRAHFAEYDAYAARTGAFLPRLRWRWSTSGDSTLHQ